MELDEKVNVLVAELGRENKNVRGNTKAEARNLREELDRLKGKVEEVRKEVNVRSKNRVEGGRSGNETEHVRLDKSKEGAGKQDEWIQVKGENRKKR